MLFFAMISFEVAIWTLEDGHTPRTDHNNINLKSLRSGAQSPLPACRACADVRSLRSDGCDVGNATRNGSRSMKKTLPEKMFADEQSRLSVLRAWVLEQNVTEIEMNERQFWNLAALQPAAEKPWITFMGRPLRVSDMPADVQKCLGIHDRTRPGAI
jgi:hypothetical protein